MMKRIWYLFLIMICRSVCIHTFTIDIRCSPTQVTVHTPFLISMIYKDMIAESAMIRVFAKDETNKTIYQNNTKVFEKQACINLRILVPFIDQRNITIQALGSFITNGTRMEKESPPYSITIGDLFLYNMDCKKCIFKDS